MLLEFIGALAGIASGIVMWIPQVRIRRRAVDVSATAPGTFVVNAAAALLWVAYGLGHADVFVWAPCIPSLIASIALVHRVTRRQAEAFTFTTTDVVAVAA